jgi:NAD(P)-dependent dehydrogenase (short-subunit alcohol dehydrogenase family)
VSQFETKVALITGAGSGAGSGIGRAVARRLRDEGAAVVAVDIDEAGLAGTAGGGEERLTTRVATSATGTRASPSSTSASSATAASTCSGTSPPTRPAR